MREIKICRPQAELLVDLLIDELEKQKNIYTYECLPLLEEVAVEFGMCNEAKFDEWLKVRRADNIAISQPIRS